MNTVKTLAKEIIPDCCMSCSEILIGECTLCCNCTGMDVLPFQKCSDFKRLKWYGVQEEEIQMPTWV